MFIEHLAVWCKDLEAMKAFYIKWFNASSNTMYYNPVKKFSSYFLSFDKGPRLELMQMPNIPDSANDILKQFIGLTHFAISVSSAEQVNIITEEMRNAGITILSEPRFTGDGYYESVVADPEGNKIEITA